MIDAAETSRRAGALGVDERHIENDYVLNHVLAAIAERTSTLIFRGGTALARVYWPDYRLSEDLDFISAERVELEPLLRTVTGLASRRTGYDISFELGKSVDGWVRSFAVWNQERLQIDINMHERASLSTSFLAIDLPYQHLQSVERDIEVLDIDEILGNKWHMMGESDRKEPRDLFDIWAGLQRSVSFGAMARGHKAKYGYQPTATPLRIAEDLNRLWEERLAHQVADLPAFNDVLAAVASAFQSWNAGR